MTTDEGGMTNSHMQIQFVDNQDALCSVMEGIFFPLLVCCSLLFVRTTTVKWFQMFESVKCLLMPWSCKINVTDDIQADLVF